MSDNGAAGQQERPSFIEAAKWAFAEWLAFHRAVWVGLCTTQGVSEVGVEPAPIVPEEAQLLPEGYEGERSEEPYAVWLRFRKLDMMSAGRGQMSFYDNLLAAPTVKALLAVCQEHTKAFLNTTAEQVRSGILIPGLSGSGQRLGPGVPKRLRGLVNP